MEESPTQVLQTVMPSLQQGAWFLGIILLTWLLFLPVWMRGRGKGVTETRQSLLGIAYPVIVIVVTVVAAVTNLFPKDDPQDATRLNAWFTFWALIVLIKVLNTLALSVFERQQRPFPIPPLLYRLLLAVLYTTAFLGAIKLVGNVDITPVLATSAVLTMVLGFALQGVLGNLLAGMSLSLVRTVEVGNLIGVDGVEGIVVNTNWRETMIRTRDDDYVYIPNNLLASHRVTNFSKPDQSHRHHIDVGASYSDAPGEVIEALVEAAQDSGVALDKPAARAVVTAYLDFGINYRLYFWTNRYWQRYQVEGEVGRHIWYKFKRRGIEIPFPMSDKLLNDFMAVVYNQRKLPPSEGESERLLNELRNSDFLKDPGAKEESLLSDETVGTLAKHCHFARYTKGETLFRQGETGDSCYVVVSGAVSGSITFKDGGRSQTTTFITEPGKVFGEMSLLTGAPRTATGKIEEETELIEIPGHAFAQFLAEHDSVMEQIAKTAAERNKKNQEFLMKIEDLSAQDVETSCDEHKVINRLKHLASWGKKLIG